jgi:hypothetical protein
VSLGTDAGYWLSVTLAAAQKRSVVKIETKCLRINLTYGSAMYKLKAIEKLVIISPGGPVRNPNRSSCFIEVPY